MAFCIYCGTKLGENDRFCGACGKKVAVMEPVPAPATVIYRPAAAPDAEKTVAEAPVSEPVFTAPAEEAPAAEPVFEAPAADLPAAGTVFSAPAEEETAAPVTEVVFAAPVADEPLPQEPLFAAPITREHVRNAATPAAAQPMPFGNKSARGSSASYSYATPERVANPVKNKVVRPKRKFLAAFLSVILCIALLAAMLPAYVLITVRNSLSSSTFLAVMQRIDLDELPATILDEYDSSLRGLSVAEALCNELNDQVGRDVSDWKEITPKTLDKILDETAFLPFIADHAEGILKAFLDGEDNYRISTKEIVKVLEQDLNLLSGELDLQMEESDLDEFADDIMEEFGLDNLELPTSQDIDEDTQMALDLLSILLSFYAIGGVALMLLLLVLLLFAANHRDPMYALRDLGIVSILGTILPLLLVLGGRAAVAVFIGKDAEMYLISIISSCVLESSLIPVAVVFGLGVALLIVNGIVRKAQNKKAMA